MLSENFRAMQIRKKDDTASFFGFADARKTVMVSRAEKMVQIKDVLFNSLLRVLRCTTNILVHHSFTHIDNNFAAIMEEYHVLVGAGKNGRVGESTSGLTAK